MVSHGNGSCGRGERIGRFLLRVRDTPNGRPTENLLRADRWKGSSVPLKQEESIGAEGED
jgi:hypothetical protein